MNRIYNVVWNHFKKDYVVTSELAAQKRVASSVGNATIVAFTLISLLGGPALAQETSLEADNISDKGIALDSIVMLTQNHVDKVVNKSTEEEHALEEEDEKQLKKLQLTDTQPTVLFKTRATSDPNIGELLPDKSAIQIGKGAKVNSGDGAIAIGQDASVNKPSTGSSMGAIAIGKNAKANNQGAIALGKGATAEVGAFAAGWESKAVTYSIALGDNSKVLANNSVGIGYKANIGEGGINAIAIGYNSNSTAKGSVAIGSNSSATVENTVSFGNDELQRKLVNIADGLVGENSKEAVTGGQLFVIGTGVAAALGGGAKLDENGTLIMPNYKNALAADKDLNSVEAGFNYVGGQLTEQGKQLADQGSKITEQGTKIDDQGKQLADQGSKITEQGTKIDDQGKQLADQGSKITDIDGRVTQNTSDITNINESISNIERGTLGLVQLAKSEVETEDGESQEVTTLVLDNVAAKEADVFNISNGKEGRTLTGLADGTIAEGSKDAVTGDQLYSANSQLSKALMGDKAELNTDGTLKEGIDFKDALGAEDSITDVNAGFAHVKGEFDKTNKNVTDVTNALGGLEDNGTWKLELGKEGSKATVTNVKDAFENIDGRVVSNSESIVNIENKVSAGTLGLVQLAKSEVETEDGDSQEVTTLVIDNVAAKEADVFNISNGKEGRTLTGVKAGQISEDSLDAINGSQLYSANSQLSKALMGDKAELNTDGTLKEGIDFKDALGAEDSITDVNAGFAHVKGEFDKTNKNVTDVTNALGGLEDNGTWKLELGKEGSKATVTNVKDAFENIDGRVVSNSESIVNIENKVSAGTLGLVQLAKSEVETEDGDSQEVTTLVIDNVAAKEADVFNISNGKEGRTLTGLADGTIAEGSKDAVTGDQLYSANSQLSKALMGDKAELNTDGTLKEGIDFKDALGAEDSITDVNAGFAHVKGEFDKTNKNVTDVTNALGGLEDNGTWKLELGKEGSKATVTNVKDAFENIDGRVVSNSESIVNIENKVSAGTLGLVQLAKSEVETEDGDSQEVTTLVIDNVAAKEADVFNISNGKEGRTLTGVKAGQISEDSLDAINGSQLYSANSQLSKALMGDKAELNTDGTLKEGIDFKDALGADESIVTVNDGFAHVKGEFDKTNKNVTDVTNALGGLEDNGTWKLELGKEGSKATVTNVKDAFENIDGRVVSNSESIVNIENKVSAGTLGLVQLAKSQVETEDGDSQEVTTLVIDNVAAKEADVFNISNGKEGRTLTGVKAGQISEDSLDAINGSQLYSANSQLSKALMGDKAELNTDGTLKEGIDFKDALGADESIVTVNDGFAHVKGEFDKTNKNVTDVTNALGGLEDNGTWKLELGKEGSKATVTNVKDAFENIDGRVVSNSESIVNIENKVSAGTLGLVQLAKSQVETEDGDSQEVTTLVIDNVAAKEADVFNISNGKEGRTLTGVKAGQISEDSLDAINGSQLYSANSQLSKALMGDKAELNTDGTLKEGIDFKDALGADESIVTVNDGFAHVKGEFDKTNKNVTDVTNALGGLEDNGTWKLELGKEGSKATVTNVKDAFENIDGRVVSNSESIVNIENKVSAGTLGLVQLAKSQVETEDGDSQEVTTLVIDNVAAKEADVFNISNGKEGRTLTGVKAGQISEDSLDAINGSQLYSANSQLSKALMGDKAELNTDGTLKEGIDFKDALGADESIVTVNDGFAHVKGEFDKTNKNVTDVTNALGGLEDNGTWKLELGKEGSKATVTNVKDAFENIDGRVVSNSESIVNIENKVSAGTLGLVQLAKSQVETEDGDSQEVTTLVIDNVAAKEADVFNISNGKEGRTLTGVKAGQISEDSLDAINGSQLYSANSQLSKALMGDKAELNTDGTLKEGIDFKDALGADESIVTVNDGFAHVKGEFDKTNKNVTDVTNALGGLEDNGTWKLELGKEGSKATVTNVKDAFENIDGRVVSNSESIVNIENKVSAGTLGLVQLAKSQVETEDGDSQEVTTLVIDNVAAKEADVFNISNGKEGRTLTGVKAGQISEDSLDAINGSQLYSANSQLSKALMGDKAELNTDGTLKEGIDFKDALGADESIVTVNDGFAHVKGEFDKTNKNVTDVTNALGGLEDNGTWKLELGKEGSKATVTNVKDAFENIDGRVVSNSESIVNIENKVSAGTLGLVQLAKSQVETEDGESQEVTTLVIDNVAAKEADVFNISNGKEGRTLTGVKAGQISEDSLDAINGSQLYSANSQLSKALMGDKAELNTDGTLKEGIDFKDALGADESIVTVNDGFAHVKGEFDKTNKNVTDVTNALGGLEDNGTWKLELGKEGSKATVTNVKDAFENIDGRVVSNSESIVNIENKVSAGTLGLVQLAKSQVETEDGDSQEVTTLVIDNVAAKEADVFNISNGKEGRTLTGVKAGQISEDSLDAINGSQLYSANSQLSKALMGDKAELNTDGTLKEGIDFKDALGADESIVTVNDGFAHVKGEFDKTNKNVTDVTNALGGLEDNGTWKLELGKEGSKATVTNVKDAFENIDGRVVSNSESIVNIENKVSAGTLGLVQLAKSQVETEDGESQEVTTLVIDNVAAKEADVFNISNGKEGRTLTGVKAGQISEDSLDAINGSQLYSANSQLSKALMGDKAELNTDGTLKEGIDFKDALGADESIVTVNDGFAHVKGEFDKTNKNVTDVTNALGGLEDNGTWKLELGKEGSKATVTNVKDAFENIDGRVVSNSESIVNIENKVSAGTLGLVQLAKSQVETEDGDSQEVTTLVIDNVAAKEADVFNISNGKEGRTLTGVKAGQISEDSLDAINGSQLYSANSQLSKALMGDKAELNTDGTLKEGIDFKDALGADESIVTVNDGFAHVKGEFDKTNKNVTDVTNALGGLEDNGTWKLELGKEGSKATVTNVKDAFENIDGRVVSNSESIVNIENKVSAGTLGLVQLAKSQVETEDGESQEVTTLVIDNVAAKEADVFNISNGKEGRTLTGVKAGQISEDSLDAINGSQLYSANSQLSKALMGDKAELNTDGTLKEGIDFKDALGADESIVTVNDGFAHVKGEFDKTNKNVTDVTNALGGLEDNGTWKLELGKEGSKATVTNVKDAFENIDGRVVSNSESIVNIENKVSAGTLGLVQLAKSEVETEDGDSQEVTTLVIDNVAAKEADVFNISNGKEGRTLTGVKAGQISEDSLDAINGSQLYSANQNVAKVLGGDATFKDGQLTGVDFSGAFTYTNAQQRSANKITTVYDGFAHLDESIGKLNSDFDTKLGELDGRVSSLETGQSGIILAPGATGKGDEVSQDMVSNTPPVTEVVKPNTPVESTPPTLGNTPNEGQITINGGIAGNADLNIAQDNGEGDGRKLTGVADGKIKEGSNDAINGGQLYTSNDAIANLIGGGAKIDGNGNVYYDENTPALTINGQGYKTVADAIEAVDQGQLFRVEGKEIVVNGATGATTVNFGNGDKDRVLTGVADGRIAENSNDAVNGGQLWELDQKVDREISSINNTLTHYNTRMNQMEKKIHENRKVASAGVAGAMAMSSIPYIEYSKYSFGMGVGYYDGESAISMGIQGKINSRARYRLQMSYDTQNKVGLGAGVAFEL